MSKTKNIESGSVLYKSKKSKVYQWILGIILGIYALFCFMPILLVFIIAFSSNDSVRTKGFSYFPTEWATDGFKYVLQFGKQLFVSYGVTIFVTLIGTAVGLVFMSLYGYAISRKDFQLRKVLAGFMIFPMLFSGGQMATYVMYTQLLHLYDNILVLILPLSVTTMNVIILRTYVSTSVPEELMDSAKIDGAGEYRTFFQIVFPLMKPALAAVGFMMATAYWNDWQNALLYISERSTNKMPLQLLLIRIQRSIEFLLNSKNIPSSALAAMQGNIPEYPCIMATVVLVVGPILVVYPFFQKYFIKGLTVGSVKG